MSEGLHAANPRPCSACPWRVSNQGKRHPGGWYSKSNRQRLWAKLRTGDGMSCHPTDPRNPVPEGSKAVPEDTSTHECTGALILQQREVMRFSVICERGGDWRTYRREYPKGMTREGLGVIVTRGVFAGTPLGGLKMSKPNLNEADIDYLPLGEWDRHAPPA